MTGMRADRQAKTDKQQIGRLVDQQAAMPYPMVQMNYKPGQWWHFCKGILLIKHWSTPVFLMETTAIFVDDGFEEKDVAKTKQ